MICWHGEQHKKQADDAHRLLADHFFRYYDNLTTQGSRLILHALAYLKKEAGLR